MALVVADRVQETTTTTGTGTVTLAGAVSGFQSFFNAGLNNADTTYYCITSGTAWEVGLGTFSTGPNAIARTTILASSNFGSAITLAGTSNVFCVYPASKAVYEDASGNIAGYPFTAGTINSTTIGASSASTGAFTTLSASSTVSGTGFSTYLASPPAIGGTAAAAGTFTTIVASTSASVGSAAPAGTNFYNAKNITGATSAYGNFTSATIQSDVTANARGYTSFLGTAAASFSTAIQHFYAGQGTIGAGSTVNSQIGHYSESNLLGATNNYAFAAADTAAVTAGKTAFGFHSNVNTATGGGTTYGFYSAGTAPSVFTGTVNIGTNGVAGVNFYNAKAITGATSANACLVQATVQSDVTAAARGYATVLTTAAASFSTSIQHFYANQSSIGAGSTVTSQFGFLSESNLIGGTGNYAFYANNTAAVTAGKTAYGFYSSVNTATGGGTTYGFYSAGTAPNVFTGTVNIGTNGLAGVNFYNARAITGNATISYGNATSATIQSDVTGTAVGYRTDLATAASVTLTNLNHFQAGQGTFSGTSVTSQFGFNSGGTLIGATGNYAFFAADTAAVTAGKTAYGFYSGINTATGGGTTFGVYSAGTAPSVFRGNVYFGNTGVTPTAKIHVAAGSATASTAPLKFTSGTNLTAVEAGVVEYDGTIMSATPNANFKRGTIPITNYTSGVGTSLTAGAEATLQVLLPAANDTITLSIGTYFLDLACTFTRGTVSTTSAQAQINILGSGAAVGSFSGMSLSSPTAGGATANFAFNAVNINTSNIVTAASTTVSGVYTITLRGMLKVTTAGTIVPQYNLSANLASAGTATAPNVLYFNLRQMDTQSAAAFGPAGAGWG